MSNYREIAFDIDFSAKKVVNSQIVELDELTQNDHNSSILSLRLLQKGVPISLFDKSIVLNFLLPDGKDYRIDIVDQANIDLATSIVKYHLPKDVLSNIGIVVGTVSLYKDGYRHTSIVQFKFEVVKDIVSEAGIIASDNYPILTSLINEIQTIQQVEESRVAAEESRTFAELERMEIESQRSLSEKDRALKESERQASESIREISELNRETMEGERQKAERERAAFISEVKANETVRTQSESSRKEAEEIRVQSESDRVAKETQRQSSETQRQANETLRQQAEASREAKQNEFNTRAEQVATRIEEEAVRITNLVEIEDGKIVHEADKTDYMGTVHKSIKDASDSNVEYILGEVNTVSYEGQRITATDTIEKQVKSATLKGQTLVNLNPKQMYNVGFPTSDSSCYSEIVKEDNNITFTLNSKPSSWFYLSAGVPRLSLLKPNTKYLVYFGTSTAVHSVVIKNGDGTGVCSNTVALQNGRAIITTNDLAEVGAKSQLLWCAFKWDYGTFPYTVSMKDVMLFEYQDGMENWDIPYFEGMASVVNPSVTDIGKNLVDKSKVKYNTSISIITGIEIPNSTNYVTTDYIEVSPNENYVSNTLGVINFYDLNKNLISVINSSTLPQKFSTPINCKYIRVRNYELLPSLEEQQSVIEILQIEKGSIPTEYEPYKSNTITTTEEIVLRSLPNGVCDTLNLLTGEYVQRIGEVTFDGSSDESWKVSTFGDGSTGRLSISISDRKVYSDATYCKNMLCDKEIVRTFTQLYTGKQQGIAPYYSSNTMSFYKTDIATVEQLKTYLQSNPITVQYELATPIVKTVDLNNQRIYSYDGITHYMCGSNSVSQSLIPTLAIDVPTNLASLVSRQNSIIEVQKEQIQTLEQENAILTETQAVQDEDILVNLLASTELFEMVLGLTPSVLTMSDDGKENSMVEVYVTLILKGQKTIEDVPMIIREKVQAQLDLILE